ncbi:hypothetical protein M0R45_002003 [Rubus argutus]|uniref:Uncharacterized protein n=1 Tax=Rubus argutus TaxID=59490 RepID=A0AAW1VDM1_RUBAR
MNARRQWQRRFCATPWTGMAVQADTGRFDKGTVEAAPRWLGQRDDARGRRRRSTAMGLVAASWEVWYRLEVWVVFIVETSTGLGGVIDVEHGMNLATGILGTGRFWFICDDGDGDWIAGGTGCFTVGRSCLNRQKLEEGAGACKGSWNDKKQEQLAVDGQEETWAGGRETSGGFWNGSWMDEHGLLCKVARHLEKASRRWRRKKSRR